SRWTIGLKTPTLLVGFYIGAFVIAISNYCFFVFLSGRQVGRDWKLSDRLPQSMVSAISTAFVFLFRSFLVASLGIAFTQRIWRLFRIKPLTASTIDLLYTILRNPVNFLYPQVIRSAKIEYAFATLIWIIPLATIFPPGALRVGFQPNTVVQSLEVSTFDPTLHRLPRDTNFSRSVFINLTRQALFSISYDGDYVEPLPEIIRPIKQSLIRGSYLTSPPPMGCGQNCTYSLNFTGPAFKCTDISSNPLQQNSSYHTHEAFVATEGCYLGGSQSGISCQNFNISFTMEFYTDERKFSKINCDAYLADYNVDVTYNLGLQHIHTIVKRQSIINATLATRGFPFYIENNAFNADIGGPGYKDGYLGTDTDFILHQLRAIRDATLQTGSDPFKINGTMILETPWQTFPLSSLREDGKQIEVTDLPMDLNVTILEDMIINATLSLLTLGNWTTVVSANVITYDTVYNFDRKAFLILPYGIALGLSLIFIYIGAAALVSNGVPADNGGFLQVACTTTGNETFEQAAAGGCLGGDKISVAN
ncbi:hypothetical protein BDD12DRAFT_949477, partial [Trichophaea hybrida]